MAVKVVPKQIKYGFITVRAERWKTLRAMTLLDVAYLDQDVRCVVIRRLKETPKTKSY